MSSRRSSVKSDAPNIDGSDDPTSGGSARGMILSPGSNSTSASSRGNNLSSSNPSKTSRLGSVATVNSVPASPQASHKSVGTEKGQKSPSRRTSPTLKGVAIRTGIELQQAFRAGNLESSGFDSFGDDDDDDGIDVVDLDEGDDEQLALIGNTSPLGGDGSGSGDDRAGAHGREQRQDFDVPDGKDEETQFLTTGVEVPDGTGPNEEAFSWKKLFAFMGPAFFISVGYEDPGNWATDIEAGSTYGYSLLWVLVMSNMMALLLQVLAARVGIVTGRDLAQLSNDEYGKKVATVLWILTEVAIAATDLAEVIGTAIGLNLLIGIPLMLGTILTVFTTFLFMAFEKSGIRRMEAFILVLLSIISVCFLIEMFIARPALSDVLGGLKPRIPSTPPGALYVAISMLGATVMPHNFYLHSYAVQSRNVSRTASHIRQACFYNAIDSMVALNVAFFVNAAILVLSAKMFWEQDIVVKTIQDAHELLEALLSQGNSDFAAWLAPKMFGLGLLCAGQSSTLTGTMAGQVVMEGFLNIGLKPWVRMLLTRSAAIVPTVIVVAIYGDEGTYRLLIFSQVILSLQLPFAVIPLVKVACSTEKMTAFAAKGWVKWAAYLAASIIVVLNIALVIDGLKTAPNWALLFLIPLSVGLGVLLVFMTTQPIRPVRSIMIRLGGTEMLSVKELTQPLTENQQERLIGGKPEDLPANAIVPVLPSRRHLEDRLRRREILTLTSQ